MPVRYWKIHLRTCPPSPPTAVPTLRFFPPDFKRVAGSLLRRWDEACPNMHRRTSELPCLIRQSRCPTWAVDRNPPALHGACFCPQFGPAQTLCSGWHEKSTSRLSVAAARQGLPCFVRDRQRFLYPSGFIYEVRLSSLADE